MLLKTCNYAKSLKDTHCCRFLGGYDLNKTSTMVPLETFFGPRTKKDNVLKKQLQNYNSVNVKKNIIQGMFQKKAARKNIFQKMF